MPPLNFKLADWTTRNHPSVMERMLRGLSDPQMISFALGLPAPELLPAKEFAACFDRVLQKNAVSLQYQPPLRSLKSHIVKLMKTRGVETSEDNVFLTTGAQQGANLLVHLLLNVHGDVILEEKTYTGFQQILKPFNPRIFVIPSLPNSGFDIEALSELLENGVRPTFFYTVADGHNPLSLNLDLVKRQALIRLARAYNFPIIEDDPYGFLNYDEKPLPPLLALDPEFVFYVGTFSKILAPTLRTGWIIVPEELMRQLGSLKEAADINTATLNQFLINEFFETQDFDSHLLKLKTEYARRRNALSEALRENFQSFARWRNPANGLFTWLEFPDWVDSEILLESALANQKVAFIPGHLFNVSESRDGSNCVRLNFTNARPETIYDGVGKIATAIEEIGFHRNRRNTR